MMYSEFLNIAKTNKVSYEVYKSIVEPMYMATPEDMTKQEFIKLLNIKVLENKSKQD